LGDFNMSPFEAGLAAAHTFNATLSEQVAFRETRKFQDNEYPFFYNPCWATLAARPIPGTYYYNSSDSLAFYYYTFDQVLVRPSLISALAPGGVVVHHTVGQESLVRAGRPDKNTFSDHLPVSVSLTI
jgi:hypothetical protein